MLAPRHSILVFDSGIGGLSIVKALRCDGPPIFIDYLADTQYFPYGAQPDDFLKKRIISLIGEAIDCLNPSLTVIACNTASTLALGSLRAYFPQHTFVGCIPPLRLAARESQTKTIGLLATPATLRRAYLSDLQARYAPNCHVITHPTPRLASCAERYFYGEPISRETINEQIGGLFEAKGAENMDTVGIGCTHYSFLKPFFKACAPHSVKWVDPAPAVARQTRKLLQNMAPITKKHALRQQHLWMTHAPSPTNFFQKKIHDLGFYALSQWR